MRAFPFIILSSPLFLTKRLSNSIVCSILLHIVFTFSLVFVLLPSQDEQGPKTTATHVNAGFGLLCPTIFVAFLLNEVHTSQIAGPLALHGKKSTHRHWVLIFSSYSLFDWSA